MGRQETHVASTDATVRANSGGEQLCVDGTLLQVLLVNDAEVPLVLGGSWNSRDEAQARWQSIGVIPLLSLFLVIVLD